MTDTTGTAVPRDEPTEVRFGIRGMLIMMAVVAVCATAFGAFVRLFREDARWHVILFWGMLIAILAGLSAMLARRRYMAEKKIGRTLFELTPHSYLLPRAPRAASILAGVFLMAIAPPWWAIESVRFLGPNPNKGWFGIGITQIYVLAASCGGNSYLWWSRRIRLGAKGVLLCARFLSWEFLDCWYWDAYNRGVVVIEFLRSNKPIERAIGQVEEGQRAAIAQLLDEKRKVAEADKRE